MAERTDAWYLLDDDELVVVRDALSIGTTDDVKPKQQIALCEIMRLEVEAEMKNRREELH